MGNEGFHGLVTDLSHPQKYNLGSLEHLHLRENGISDEGGGMRGHIPALFLNSFENYIHEQHGRRIKLHELFDFIGGTSIGLTIPGGNVLVRETNPMDSPSLVRFFTEKGSKIFGNPRFHTFGGRIFDAKYSAETLEKALGANFKDCKLSQALTPVIITGVRTDGQRGLETFMFDSFYARQESRYDFLARDVARATSAAHSYLAQLT